MNTIKRMGEGFITGKHTEYLNTGEQVEIETTDIDLSGNLYVSKLALTNIETTGGLPGQVLMMSDAMQVEWADPQIPTDKAMREEYPSLQIAWDTVMEALNEYELVKKLVQDYDKD